MKPKYTPQLPLRCASSYTVTYMYLNNQKVRMCVGMYNNVKKVIDGDGKVFENLEKAREFAYNRGYIVYDEELSENSLNKS